MESLGVPLFVARPHVRVSFHRKGPWLIGVAHLQGPGAPVILTARANLEELEKRARALLARRAEQGAAVGSFFGPISHVVKSVGHSVEKVAKGKIARQLYRQVRKTMKSPVVSAALMATAVVFPPVGIPASAAFVSANLVLDKVEAGGAAAEQAKKQIQSIARLARQPGAMGEKARKVAQVVSITHQWRQGLKVAQARAKVAGPAAPPVSTSAPVRGEFVLPNGKRAHLRGVQRAGRIIATVTLPSGRRVPLRASVQGGCGC